MRNLMRNKKTLDHFVNNTIFSFSVQNIKAQQSVQLKIVEKHKLLVPLHSLQEVHPTKIIFEHKLQEKLYARVKQSIKRFQGNSFLYVILSFCLFYDEYRMGRLLYIVLIKKIDNKTNALLYQMGNEYPDS